MQDIMDGFFPSELQDRYPDGVPFEVHEHVAHVEITILFIAVLYRRLI